ncbi:hypothetical protein [Sphingomonas bacterium]|uniref:hypothetical protein n=1 Tax=Sphingomonas bacterium TaxID=1895847 RepID=UPI0015754245|nr:hypothetical protein [Sphingomonas bacterium]
MAAVEEAATPAAQAELVEPELPIEPQPPIEEVAAKPKRSRRKAEPAATEEAPAIPSIVPTAAEATEVGEDEAPAGEVVEAEPARRGWWQRTFGA